MLQFLNNDLNHRSNQTSSIHMSCLLFHIYSIVTKGLLSTHHIHIITLSLDYPFTLSSLLFNKYHIFWLYIINLVLTFTFSPYYISCPYNIILYHFFSFLSNIYPLVLSSHHNFCPKIIIYISCLIKLFPPASHHTICPRLISSSCPHIITSVLK